MKVGWKLASMPISALKRAPSPSSLISPCFSAVGKSSWRRLIRSSVALLMLTVASALAWLACSR
ncbi:hypothetical protein D3C78_1975750 [compost metagenome]